MAFNTSGSSWSRKIILALLGYCPVLFLYGSPVDSLYKKADAFYGKFADKMYYSVLESGTIESCGMFWYRTRTPEGTAYLLLDPEHEETRLLFEAPLLANALKELTGEEIETDKFRPEGLRVTDGGNRVHFYFRDHEYDCTLPDYSLIRNSDERQRNRPQPKHWSSVSSGQEGRPVVSPDGKLEAYIRENNVWIRSTASDGDEPRQLSFDGSPGEYYASELHWSPDSRMLAGYRNRPAPVRKLTLISSSPRGQLQPLISEYDYVKPGDALSVRRPVCFDVENGTSTAIDFPGIENQYELGRIRWSASSRRLSFDLNYRGHQRYAVYGFDIQENRIYPVVDETSPTFIHYNALYKHWLEDTDEMIWISERDGWRHLYLYDVGSGQVKRQLTSGQWIVKRVVQVDEQKRQVLFIGCGREQAEDPYLEKYYILEMDNGRVRCLTPENGNHRISFSNDKRFLLDIYSRVDAVPRVVIRSAEDGRIVYSPENQPDISTALQDGWRMPEVFRAKGRDGKTDIWGVIIRPTDFDPQKKYPVIEYIYAGPHDSHVPKDFNLVHRTSALSELGFITVLIDGMGTANRSKTFHDVCWQNLKDAGFPDRIAWMKAAAGEYSEMDLTRVGIYGASAGGQNAMGALLFHPEFYKVGVAACGCHDNRMDKIWWNEQWMGYPIGPHYAASSNVVNAGLLEGKLMLILGELDNNVDPSSTLQVVDELIRQNKEFELVLLPGAGHTLGESYGERKRRDFFIRHLQAGQTPEWNRNNK